MSGQWKPGDVASVSVDGGSWFPAVYVASSKAGDEPWVVDMPEPGSSDYDSDIEDATAALRSLLAPPKPDEPQGLGAVVEDEEGRIWLRMARENQTWPGEVWQSQYERQDRWAEWADVPAVKVLSEGVTS